MILLVIIVVINILGVKKIKKIQTPIVVISTTYLMLLCIWAVATGDLNWDAAISREAFGDDWNSVIGTSAFVFVSYAGVTKIAAVGGEIINPKKNIPYGILFSLAFSCILYVTVTMIMVATVDPSGYIDGNGHAREDPVYIFAEAVGGEAAGIIAAVLAVVTMTSMALAGILASSRFPFAMARDKLLPQFLEDVHGRFETPHWSIIGTGLAMGAAITFLPVHDVAELASGFQIMVFIVINACVIVLRNSSDSHAWYDPVWKPPWPLYPIIQVAGIVGGGILIVLMGPKSLIGAAAAIVLGFIIFKGYGERHVENEITPWETSTKMITNPDEVEKRRRFAAFHAADTEGTGRLNLGEFVSAIRALGYIEEESKNIDDDALVISGTRSFKGNQLVRDIFHWGDSNADGLIDIEEFIKTADDLLPEN
jgi:amino acid transporter